MTAPVIMRPQCWRHAEKSREGLCTFPTFHILFLIGVAALSGALRKIIDGENNYKH